MKTRKLEAIIIQLLSIGLAKYFILTSLSHMDIIIIVVIIIIIIVITIIILYFI